MWPLSHLSITARRLLAASSILVAGLVAIGARIEAQGVAVTRGPYLQQGTPASVVVRWRTAAATDSVVRYGPAPGQLDRVATVAGSRIDHVVTLSGLTPHTRYFYAVGTSMGLLAGNDHAHAFTTPPPSGASAPVRIWVLGDAGTANATARAVRDAYLDSENSLGTQMALLLGDNAYPDGTDNQYQAAVFDTFGTLLRRAVTWSTFGNHDATFADAVTGTGPYFDLFTFPTGGEAGGIASGTEAYYSFDYGNIHVVCLDSSESDRSPTGPMARWLTADLASHAAEWTIAFFHHAPYSRGTHDSDVDTGMREMRQHLVPILEAGGVDLVLGGHSHTYERSMLISGHYGVASSFSPAHVVDGSDGNAGGYQKVRGNPAGAVYVLSGSAGSTGPGLLNHPVMETSASTTGSLVIDVDGGRLRAFYLRDTGAVNDAFTLLKRDAAGPPTAPWGLRTQEVLDPHYLSWREPDGGGPIEGYRIEAGTAPGRTDIGVLTVGHTTVQPFARTNGRFFVRVRAFNRFGVSPPSDDLEIVMAGGFANGVVPADVRPPTPTGVIRATVTGGRVQLTWPAGGYGSGDLATRLEIGTRPGLSNLGSFWPTGNTFEPVPPGVYFVRFRRANVAGESEPSLDTQVVVGGVPSPPDRAGDIRAAIVRRTVAMSWAPPAGPTAADYYVIEAGLAARTTALRLRTADKQPQYVVHDVPPGAYFVRVRAANALGEGVASRDTRIVVP